jgi:hypothetical protein
MIILRLEPTLPPEGQHEKRKDERQEAYYSEKLSPKDFLLHQGLLRESESRRGAGLHPSWWLPGPFVHRLQVMRLVLLSKLMWDQPVPHDWDRALPKPDGGETLAPQALEHWCHFEKTGDFLGSGC